LFGIYHDFVNIKLEKRKALQLDAGTDNRFSSPNKKQIGCDHNDVCLLFKWRQKQTLCVLQVLV